MSHSIVLPFSSRPADLQLYTVVVPDRGRLADHRGRAEGARGDRLPPRQGDPGLGGEDRADGTTGSTSSAGPAPHHPTQFAEFRLIARNPILEGDLPWRITQTYGNGETVRWIGPPGSEFPGLGHHAERVGGAGRRRDRPERRRRRRVAAARRPRRAARRRPQATAATRATTIARAGAGAALLLGLGGSSAALLIGRAPRFDPDGRKGGMMLRRLGLLGCPRAVARWRLAPCGLRRRGQPELQLEADLRRPERQGPDACASSTATTRSSCATRTGQERLGPGVRERALPSLPRQWAGRGQRQLAREVPERGAVRRRHRPEDRRAPRRSHAGS